LNNSICEVIEYYHGKTREASRFIESAASKKETLTSAAAAAVTTTTCNSSLG
jgi:hypothetical protein